MKEGDSMYVEFVEGQKFPFNDADQMDSPAPFQDAGYVLNDFDLVVDIDNIPKDIIKKMLVLFKINTETVWTDRGVHLYFKKPRAMTRGSNRICALGFKVELKHKKNTQAVAVKRNGVLRERENPGVREELPQLFSVNKKFNNLWGMDEGEGRNDALFKHRTQLAGVTDWQLYIRFINENIFAQPLPEEELNTILRDLNVEADKDNEPLIAEFMMREFKMLTYAQSIYFYYDGDYINDMNILKRLVFEKVGSQKTRYVDEVIKQIEYRTPLIPESKVFDIKFNNGILRDGEFIEVDYDEFTPYHIKVDYDPEAEPVADVDNYISHLTQGDPDYTRIIYEILAHTLIVNKEFKRLLAKFFIFIGDGGNGKGTLLQIIKFILGEHNCTGHSISNMSDERYFVTMKGKLANLGDDIHDEPINNDQMKQLKNISTCDFISARELYKQSDSIQLTISLIFTSNHVLKTFEKGKSYKRRVMWLPMFTEVTDENKDPNFISKLTTEKALKYWMRRILEGYFRLYENEKFTESDIVNNYNTLYHKENNTTLIFLDDYVKADIQGKRLSEIYMEYETWCEDNALSLGSKRMMQDSIKEVFDLIIGVKRINGRSTRVFIDARQTVQGK